MNRTHVLQEIRRTAAANGGEPLGSRRFASETGIRQADWQGKLWARWSDAVREAGLAPNQLRGAYDEEELLELYAKLAQELRHLPTANDLRLKDRSDPAYPNQKVFERFGAKAELVRRVLEFCRGREGYEAVVLLCEAYSAPKRMRSREAASPEQEVGFVYLMKSGRFYKIGKSNSAPRREYELGIQLPERITTVHVIRTDDPAGIEAYWHKRFESKRKNGEWFDLNAADVTAFKRRKFM